MGVISNIVILHLVLRLLAVVWPWALEKIPKNHIQFSITFLIVQITIILNIAFYETVDRFDLAPECRIVKIGKKQIEQDRLKTRSVWLTLINVTLIAAAFNYVDLYISNYDYSGEVPAMT